MKLSLKQKALLITIGVIFGVVFGSMAVTFILANVSYQTVVNALGVGFVAFFIWMFYSITLSQLEYQEKLKELKKTVESK